MKMRILNPDADLNWRIPDELWSRIEPLLPPGKPHRFKGHYPAVPSRKAMDAIFFVLRTGCQWNALNVTGLCHSSSAHRAFQAGQKARRWVVERLHRWMNRYRHLLEEARERPRDPHGLRLHPLQAITGLL